MEAHVGDRIVVHSTHQGEPERVGEVVECHEPGRRPALPRALGARRAHRAVLPGRDRGRRPPHRPLAAEGPYSWRRTPRRRRHRGPPGKCATWPSSATPGSGKTTLAEALLVATGALPRAGRVEDGTTCLDTEEVEVRQQRSVSLGVATVEHDGHRITLLDTPGSPDFVGELRAGLRAADAALFVVSAVNGVDATTVQLWEECAAVGMPRAVVITQLDRARADVDDAVRMCQRMLGEGVYPVHLRRPRPRRLGARPGLAARPRASPAPEADRLRAELIEGIIGESEDEALMERYLAGDQLVQADLIADLETAVARGALPPRAAAPRR